MDVRITSVTWEDVSDQVAAATDAIEQSLRHHLASQYGSELDLLFVVVSVSDDPAENHKFARAHTKVGRYERWPSSEKRQLWSVALEFPQTEFGRQTVEQMRTSIAAAMAAAISMADRKLPQSFDYEAFRADALSVLQAA